MTSRVLLAAALFAAGVAASAAETRNGFALSPASVPVAEILAGGPPRDGIPALVDPARIPAGAAPWSADEWVVGVAVGGSAAAYPLSILEWHELVNDRLGDQPILVSYCPLCGTAMVFDRRIGGRVRTFGVSGLLYQSDLLAYDHETQSLWSQIRSEAVTGSSLGERLVLVRSRMLRWGEWRALHPETTVLSPETGHRRPYGSAPYGDHATSDALRFPAPVDRRYHPKTPTLGLRIANVAARAYPAVELVRAGGGGGGALRRVAGAGRLRRRARDVLRRHAAGRRGRRGLLVRVDGLPSREQCVHGVGSCPRSAEVSADLPRAAGPVRAEGRGARGMGPDLSAPGKPGRGGR